MYSVIIWCSDCEGDEYGCFAGGSETITIDPDTGRSIETAERADEIGYLKTKDVAAWRYEVKALPLT